MIYSELNIHIQEVPKFERLIFCMGGAGEVVSFFTHSEHKHL